MLAMPKYKSPVTLIPGGCPQFLDFSLDLARVARLKRAFREERRDVVASPGEAPADAAARRRHHVLHCLRQEENLYVDLLTGKPADYDYELDARKMLDLWGDVWLPLPFLRLRDQQWPDGGERFECGPGNWARVRLTRQDEENVRVVLAFDMGVEEPPVGNEAYHALSPHDVSAHAAFRLAAHVRDNAWFVNSGWVDEWLFEIWESRQKRRHQEEDPDAPALMHVAAYLTLLDALRLGIDDITVQVINPERDNPVDVDLVLDIGNARTTGILVETLPQRPTNLNDSYLLQLRDMGRPENVCAEPFETRVEFSEVSFGSDVLSRRSGRRTPAFAWPSAVRIGPEAARLSTQSVSAEGTTGLSSPKRYLWDERPWKQTWRYNTGGGPEPMATRGLLPRRVNSQGTPLACMNDSLFTRHPILRLQDGDVAFEALFTRSSLMMFMMVEMLLQALMTINSPGQRCRRELPNVPRRLRRVIFTVPSGMPIAEQRIYRRWVIWSIQALWEALGWQDLYRDPRKRTTEGARTDYRTSPQVRCDWDEATCTQLVYVYNELIRKFQGDAHHFFALQGRQREGYGPRPCLRVAALDIGGGTTDLSITTFELQSGEGDTARLKPHPEFRDGFNIAGDDMVRDIVNRHILPAIGEAVVQAGAQDSRALLAQLFGRDVMDNSQESRNRRAQFARQIARPLALGLLSVYESTDLVSGGGAFTCRMGDFFNLPGYAESRPPQLASLRLAPAPGPAVVRYVEEAATRLMPSGIFSLMDTPIRVDPHDIDRTLRDAMRHVLANLCEMVHLYDCDALLLSGRPSRWNAIIASVLAKMPVAPDRIAPMCRFRVGSWYPFADALGNITDPKTTVVVGAILCALAEGHLEGFSFDTTALKLKSTARFIGEMDINGQIRQPKVWFEVDVDSGQSREFTREVAFSGPLAVGFRQLAAERWTTTRFHLVDFATEEARRKASGRLPYTLTMKLRVTGVEDEPDADHDEGELFIEDIQDSSGNSVSRRDVEVRLQTLQLDEGYWLDTGIVYST